MDIEQAVGSSQFNIADLIPRTCHRPRGGIHPDAFSFEVLYGNRNTVASGPADILIEKTWDISTGPKEMESEMFNELLFTPFAVFGPTPIRLGRFVMDLP